MVHMLNLLKANSLTVLSRISNVYGNEARTSVSVCVFCHFHSHLLSFGRKREVSGIPNLYDFLFTVAVSLLAVHMKIAWLCFPFQCIMAVISLFCMYERKQYIPYGTTPLSK